MTAIEAAAAAAAEFLTSAAVAVLDRDGDEFVVEFTDGRSFLVVVTEMQARKGR